ncbi:ATP-binding protein [Aliikangiella maris]|uniref:histidine kinase n=2 Tax=Aliikangiella maris TaxID=3162458 RepID=A0ABV2BRB6_9GAMM
MKRIYLSILITALISLFLLGRLIDGVFDAQNEMAESQEFVTEKKLLAGAADILSHFSESQLESQIQLLEQQFKIDLSLERLTHLSFSSQLEHQLSTENGLLIDSDSGAQLLRKIENHPQWLLVLHIDYLPAFQSTDVADLEFWLTIFFYLSFCLVLLIWAFPLTRRLSKLNRLASEFGAGDLSRRIEPIRFSYIEDLEISFNRMAGQIEELINENKILAGSISHDLRTPLSCLRFGVDAALDANHLEKKNYYLNRMDDDLNRMEKMLEAFLDYASLERKRFELIKTNTNLIQLIQSVITACQPLAEKKQVKIESALVSADEIPLLNMDPFWIGRAVTNLLTNAIDYANNRVKVSCYLSHNQIEIVVEDDGQGVPQNEMTNIFKAFVKLDKSRTQANHFGLGLAIVARVVNWHRGQVSVCQSAQLNGACFSMRFKLLNC